MKYRIRAVIAGMVCVAAAGTVRAGAITFVNDYEGFLAAAGNVQTIDFETLPDGRTPTTIIHNPITPEFNYTDQGVTFSPALGEMYVQGTPHTKYSLFADTYPDREQGNFIIADFVVPLTAVGVFFPGSNRLSVYDINENLIGTVHAGGGGPGRFAGIVSDVPIAHSRIGIGYYAEKIDSIHFAPIPEPATLVLVGFGAASLVLRRVSVHKRSR